MKRRLHERGTRAAFITIALVTLPASVALGAVGCESVIGADFNRGPQTQGDGSPGDGQDDSGGAAATDGSIDGSLAKNDGGTAGKDGAPNDAAGITDARVVAPASCGDMSGYDPGSPWPMSAFCPSRANHTPAPALVNPHILWRFDYAAPASGEEYVAGPAIAADGTVIVPGYFGVDASALVYALSFVKNRVEVFRAPLPAGLPSTPVIAKNGDIYVHCRQALAAFDKTGAPRWTTSLTAVGSSMPVILGDGTIVVLDGSKMVFIRPTDGMPVSSYTTSLTAPVPSFSGGIAVSPTGVLYAAAQPAPATLNGALHAVDSTANAVFVMPVALSGAPASSPSFDAQGNLLLSTSNGLFMFTPLGAPAGSTSTAQTPTQPYGATSGNTVWFPNNNNGPFTYDTSTQAFNQLTSEAAIYSSMIAVGDGSLVFARRSSGLTPPVRLEGWTASGAGAKSLWNVELDATGSDMYSPAVGADGTVYMALGPTLYAIGD